MQNDFSTQDRRSWNEARSRTYSRNSGRRSSPRPSTPRNFNTASPAMTHSTPKSRSVSPGIQQSSHRQQTTDHTSEDSANAHWRSWRPPEDVEAKLSSVASSSDHNYTKQAAHEDSNNDSDFEDAPMPAAELTEESKSIWNDDLWDTAELDAGTTSAIDGEQHARSGWTPEPPDQPITTTFPSAAHDPSHASATGTIDGEQHARSGWTPEPPDQPTTTTFPSAIPDPSLSDKRVVKLSISKDRKNAHNISIDNIYMELTSKKLEQTVQTSSSHADPLVLEASRSNVSPFFIPGYLGNPSPDHYDQYNNKTVSKKQQQSRPNYGENTQTKRYSTTPSGKIGHAEDSNYSNSNEVFARYLEPEEIEEQISVGALYKGVININTFDRSEAYVVAEGLDSDVYIASPKMRNRAFDGDVVAIRLCDVDAVWRPKYQTPSASDSFDSEGSLFWGQEAFERVEVLETNAPVKPKYAGEVVGIIDCPKERVFVGFLSCNQASDGADPTGLYITMQKFTRFHFRPLDKKCPFINIRDRDIPSSLLRSPNACKDTLLVVQVVNWDITKRRPSGKIIKILGEVGDMATETKAILTYCGIATCPYSSKALQCIPSIPWNIPAVEISKRRDYRTKRCFSIDPTGAKDLDDVLHIERLEDGTFEVGVHIADVSYFVKPYSQLDLEARERGSSVYLVDSVLHMLPVPLCENICSLNPGQDRLAFSVVWKLDGEANVLDTWFGKTIIASSAKLTYEEAQQVIDGGHLPDAHNKARSAIESDIINLMSLSAHLRKRRFAKGALALQSIKLLVGLDDNGEPIRVSEYKSMLANDLIEEYMLLANISVARKISSSYPNQALLRRHPEPAPRKLDKFVEIARGLGYNIDKTSSGSLQATLSNIPESAMRDAILFLATKPMQRARYFCSGSLDIAQSMHYALNEAVYTHFTSPIRRYADIIVHRQLANALDQKTESGFSRKTVERYAYLCNYRMEKAKNAEDQSNLLYLSRFLSRTKDDKTRQAIVLQVGTDFMDVYLNEFGLQRRLYVEDLPLVSSRYSVEDESLYLYWKPGVRVNLNMLMRQGFSRSKRSRPRFYVESTNQNLQKVKPFEFLDVKLEVDNHRSPPRIIMYPVNPFEDK
ncbi:hypothetical protein BX666DRAFT_2161812 [Dichotomocladium elegans]|nr:hypothetical protein BX666DRAFT_2161812 [Dichotomocladium elegans]